MVSKFGFLTRLPLLQNLASIVISRLNPVVVHNLEKYKIIHHAFYLSNIEGVDGDYLEFGVFTGSSFCHAIRCHRKLAKWGRKNTTKFYGFDSFKGFGELKDMDLHPFYTDANFTVDARRVKRRVRGVAGGNDVRLIEGYFSSTLRTPAVEYGITHARIIFVDSDTYDSASDALEFCWPVVQEGTIIILDDFYSYRGSNERGIALAFSEFLSRHEVQVRHLYTYGMGGVVYMVSKVVR